jgi:broad specificity phosphatase PhoE
MHFEKTDKLDLDLVNAYVTGSKQGPLSEKGVNQAKRVARYLAKRGIRTLYSSAFIRARQTAEETSRALGTQVVVIEDLGELNVGCLSPELYPDQASILKCMWNLQKVLPFLMGKRRSRGLVSYLFIVYYFQNWYKGRTVAGEPRLDALTRIRNSLHTLVERHGSTEKVAVFTHGYFIHLLVNHVIDPKGAPLRVLKNPYIKNGSITHITGLGDGAWKVEAYAHTAHLR